MNAASPVLSPQAFPLASRRTRHAEGNALLAMTIFMASWAMLFAALFFSYGLLRARAVAWPPADMPAIPIALPSLATVAIVLTSFGLHRTVALIRNGQAGAGRWLLVATVAAAVFLFLQVTLWQTLWAGGLTFSSGPYGSVVFGLTVFHALHIALGLLALPFLLWRLSQGAYSAQTYLPLRLWTLYFHMVDAVWVALFFALVLL